MEQCGGAKVIAPSDAERARCRRAACLPYWARTPHQGITRIHKEVVVTIIHGLSLSRVARPPPRGLLSRLRQG